MNTKGPSGIYQIVRLSSADQYIGSARDLGKRKKEHLLALKYGKHHSRYLQRAWNKYGEASFAFRIISICAEEDLFFYEQRFLDALRPTYNVNPSACGTRGLKWTEDARKRQSVRQHDPIFRVRHSQSISDGILANTTAEQRRQISINARASWTVESKRKQIEKLTGRRDSPEIVARKIASLTGHAVSEATRQKLAALPRWKHSDEAKAKMHREFTPEHRANLSAARVGKSGPRLGMSFTAESRQKISNSLLGRQRSPESIAKQRATNAVKRTVAFEWENGPS